MKKILATITILFIFKKIVRFYIKSWLKASIKNLKKGQTMTTLQAYGLIEGLERLQIELAVDKIVLICSWGANPLKLRENLLEIAAAESAMGTARDKTPNSGAGVWQMDFNTFEDIKKWIEAKKSIDYIAATGSLIKNCTYQDLMVDLDKACFFTRAFLYVRVKGAIGETREERAKQWKKYYNTIYGKGTEQHYLNMSNKFYKEVNNGI